MDMRKALDDKAIGLMLMLCVIWGLQQVVLKATAADIAPVMQIALRSGVAALLVGLVMLARGERMTLADGTWRPGVVVGLLFGLTSHADQVGARPQYAGEAGAAGEDGPGGGGRS